jgi:hypothetical protein
MPPTSEQHDQHDPLLVVSLAAGDLTGADRDRAASLIVDCADCRALHDDLLSIAQATAALPPATRPRDFQLSPEQAARLRPAGWRRFIEAFATPRLAMTRQLGVGLTTIGLAGLLISVLPGIPLGMGSAAAPQAAPHEFLSADDSTRGGASEAAASGAAPSAAPAFGGAITVGGAPSASHDAALLGPTRTSASPTSANDGLGTEGNQAAQGGPDVQGETSPAAQRDLLERTAVDGQGVSLVLVASAILLAAGIALLLARRIAGRMTGG